MKIHWQQILVVALCCAMLGTTGCTTMETVHGSAEALEEKNIRAGRKVTLNYVSGYSEPAKLTAIGEDSVQVLTDDGRRVEIDYDDLSSLDYERVEVLKTAGATVGVVALGAAVLVGAAVVGAGAMMGGV